MSAVPGEFVTRQRAGLDAGGLLEVVDGDAGECGAFDAVALLFPDLA